MSAESKSGEIAAHLAASPPLQKARAAIGDPAGIWVVGGAVRDAALGRPIVDLDLATDGDPEAIARALAREARAAVFELSGEHATWRVAERSGAWSTDVAALRGDSIAGDLALRDFTANAIAIPLEGGEPIDPTGGLADLDAGVLRAAGPTSFSDDPLRLMRLARLAAELDLAVDPATRELALDAAPRAAEPAGERRFAELKGILNGSDPVGGLELLEKTGVTAVVLPELSALRGVVQNANHHLDVHDHTIEVLRRLLEVLADLGRYAGQAAEPVAELLAQPLGDDITRAGALRFAAILHDAGKPATRTEHGGMVGFRGHDRIGAEMMREVCARFRTSRRFSDHLAQMTRDHLILGFMVRERPLPRRRVWEYLRATDPWAVDVTLLTVADRLSARGSGVPEEAIDGHLELAREILADAVAWELEGPPKPLFRGDELAAALGIEPGEQLGVLMREQEAALYAGEVGTADELIAHLRGIEKRLDS